jgi:Taurine catabolism dioxygenase TauD, TfdA family
MRGSDRILKRREEAVERLAGLVTDASAWRGPDLANASDWIITLAPTQARDLETALARVRDRPIQSIGRADFPLPSLAKALERIATELEDGRGFVLVRGFPLDGHDADAIMRLYWGFGLHLGTPISQNKFGHMIGHVRDEGAQYGTQNARGYNSSAALKFHNDNCDIVGLLCLQAAKSGGESTVTSATTIYNEFVRRRPDLVDQLYEGFHFHLRGEERPGLWAVTPHRIPTFSYLAGKLSCRYVRNAIQLAPQRTGVKLNAREIETLDLFDALAGDPALRFDMELRRGDLQLLNNHVTVHSRTAFIDHEDKALRRHLLRLWLAIPDGRPLAPDFANRYGPDVVRLGVPAVGEATPFPA